MLLRWNSGSTTREFLEHMRFRRSKVPRPSMQSEECFQLEIFLKCIWSILASTLTTSWKFHTIYILRVVYALREVRQRSFLLYRTLLLTKVFPWFSRKLHRRSKAYNFILRSSRKFIVVSETNGVLTRRSSSMDKSIAEKPPTVLRSQYIGSIRPWGLINYITTTHYILRVVYPLNEIYVVSQWEIYQRSFSLILDLCCCALCASGKSLWQHEAKFNYTLHNGDHGNVCTPA
jgi:hypothetical protein